MGNEIYVEHPNGYSGMLYGKSSMTIYFNGKEVMHTGFRNKDICDEKSLRNHLEHMPDFMNLLMGNIDDILCDDDEDD